MPPILRLSALALLIVATLAPVARASPDQQSIMMDDDLLVYRDDSTRHRAMAQMKSLGVDTVRVTVLWRVVAENARPSKREIAKIKSRRKRAAARRQAKRFKAIDPSTYPTRNWDRYDNLVRDARSLGMQVYFDVTGPGPRWAHRTAPRRERKSQGTWKPKASEFKRFVFAVGRRYSGTRRDENFGRGVLPRVSFWALWNEPNQGGWLTPQFERRGGRTVAASPALFRELYQRGREGLVSSGHGADTILLGETAPLGSSKRTSRSPMRPKQFLRELACVTPGGDRYGGSAAKARDCGAFAKRGPLLATGFAHHPYTKNIAPTRRDSNADSLTLANIDELGTLLDDLSAKTGGAIPSALPLFMTEFGFESNPPDPFSGIPLNQQADYSQLGEFIAFTKPRIAGMTQFLLRDVAPVRGRKKGTKGYYFTYQSGLFFQRGQPKPAAFAYALPFVVYPQGAGTVGYWGQLRFRPNGGADVATIQYKADSTSAWTTIGERPVNARGFFQGAVPAPAPTGEYRAVYLNPATGDVLLYSLGARP